MEVLCLCLVVFESFPDFFGRVCTILELILIFIFFRGLGKGGGGGVVLVFFECACLCSACEIVLVGVPFYFF